MIQHIDYSLVGDDAETEETLAIGQRDTMVEMPSQEAIRNARMLISAMKKNITSLERDILWVSDRQRYLTYYEDQRKS